MEAAYEVFNAERGNMVQTYNADHELQLPCEQSWVSWCPSHDIITIASHQSHLIEVYRIENEMDKVASKQVNSQPTALEYARHGRYFALGDAQGRVSLLRSDTLDELKSFVIEDSSASISALNWSTIKTEKKVKADDRQNNTAPTAQDPLDFSMHLRKLESLNPNLSQAAKDILSLLNDCGSPPSILAASDSNSTIQLMFNGNFPLCHFTLANLVESDESQVCADLIADSIKIKKV